MSLPKQRSQACPGIRVPFRRMILPIFLLVGSRVFAQSRSIQAGINKQSFIYAVKDTSRLGLDVYSQDSLGTGEKRPCVIFVFGGAFMAGRRDDSLYDRYFNSLVEHNYIVVSISYRLGLKGVKNLSRFNIAPLKKAVDMAVDDAYDATNWVISNAGKWGIDTSKIILSGSSSGAVTVLTAEFESCNEYDAAKKLPANFKYAGLVSFSGAILSYKGRLKYKLPPAPAMLFHGTADKIVPFNKIRFFNKGFYGSSWIAKTFQENSYPYYIYREVDLGHEVSVLPMIYNLPAITGFLDQYVVQRKPYQTDISFKDPGQKPLMTLTPGELFKKLQHK
jgi:predicted esterase